MAARSIISTSNHGDRNKIRRGRNGSRKTGPVQNNQDNHVESGTSPGAPDFACQCHGSIFLLYPLSRKALDWIDSHLSADRQIFGDAVVIEARFVWPIILGIQDDGLTVVPQ